MTHNYLYKKLKIKIIIPGGHYDLALYGPQLVFHELMWALW